LVTRAMRFKQLGVQVENRHPKFRQLKKYGLPVGDHQIGTPLGDQRLRAVLTIGALLVALGLGWVGGFGSHHFSAPPSSFLRECEPAKHALDTEPSKRAIGAEPHAAIRDRLQPQSVPAPWRIRRADPTAP